MKPRKDHNVLIYFFILTFLLAYFAMAESGLCTLETVGTVPNVCDRSKHLVYVVESESGCRTEGAKCWCILVDNRNRAYDGLLVVELVQTFNHDDLHPDDIQIGEIKSYLTFKVTAGLNRILLQPYLPPKALTKITSITIRNFEVCKFPNASPTPFFNFQPATHIPELHQVPNLADAATFPVVNQTNIPEIQPVVDLPVELFAPSNQSLNNSVKDAAINPVILREVSTKPEIQIKPGLSAEVPIPTSASVISYNLDLVDSPPIKPQVNLPIDSVTFIGNCGVKPGDQNPTSIGTNTIDLPWHAAIYKLQSKSNSQNYICGGTLIDQKTVITAAHCVLEQSLIIISERLIVEFGRNDLVEASEGMQAYRVFDIIAHEEYNPDSFENDIAIVILANYVRLSQYIHFVCLPAPDLNLQDQVGTSVGWGNIQNNQFETELKETSFKVIDKITCLVSNRNYFGQFLTATNFCAGFLNNTNVCHFDPGNGLILKSKNQWFLGGIASLGSSLKTKENQCDMGQYIIFTDVTKYIHWIKRSSIV